MLFRSIKNLQPILSKYLTIQSITYFESLHDVGLAIEDAMNSGLFEKPDTSQKGKRVYSGASNSLYGNGGSSGSNNHQGNYGYSYNGQGYNNNSTYRAPEVNYVNQQPGHVRGQPRVFSDFGIPLSLVFKWLESKGILRPLNPLPLPNPLPPRHDTSKHCRFHQVTGHDTDFCARLRHEIQDLIDKGVIPPPTPKPNVINNPMPNHGVKGPPNVNLIDLGETRFDPSQYIISLDLPQPTPVLPVEYRICAIEPMQCRDILGRSRGGSS